MGIAVSKWVTMHGIAINVNCDLAAFDAIVPCGLAGRRVCSVASCGGDATAGSPSFQRARAAFLAAFCDVFGVEWRDAPLSALAALAPVGPRDIRV